MELAFEGIDRAEGLTSEAREQIWQCVSQLSQHMAKNNELDVYRDGTVSLGICTERVPENIKIEAACPWGNVAVQSIVERSKFDGFSFPDPESEEAERFKVITRNQSISSMYNRALKSSVTYGCGFVTVGRGKRGPIVRWHTAKTATGIWDMGEDRLECGLAIVKTKRRSAGFGYDVVPVACDFYTPGGVWELTRIDERNDWTAQYLPDPMGEPRMLAMPFMPDDESPLGHSRLSAAVRHIIREYLANALNTHVASTLYAIGQKAIMGLTKSQFESLSSNKEGLALESIILGMLDKDGNAPKLDQWAQQSMEPLISVKRSLAQDFAAATSVPISELISQDSNPTSAEALAAAKDKLISLVESMNEENRAVLRKVALMMQAIDNNVGLDGLSDDQYSVAAHMRNPATPSMAAMADSTVKLASAIEGFSKSDVCLKNLGFDESERYNIRMTQEKEAALQGAMTILNRNQPEAAYANQQNRARQVQDGSGNN